MPTRNVFTYLLPSTLIVIGLFLSVGCGKTEPRKSKMEFRKLTREHQQRLAAQRALVLSAAQSRWGSPEFTRTKRDLPILQRLIDDRVFTRTQTFELQALGVVFGDVLATELGLHWELVTDDYGTDPVLRYGTAQVQVAPLTMISKRVEDGKQVDLADLIEGVRDTLKQITESGDHK